MAEKPILFSGPMVTAIRERRKTQTRRVITFDPDGPDHYQHEHVVSRVSDGPDEHGRWHFYWDDEKYGSGLAACIRPRWSVGDRLWVRETWAEVHPCQVDEGRFSLPGRGGIPGPPPVHYRVIYRADGEYPRLHFSDGYPYRERCPPDCTSDHLHPEEAWHGWTPSIHMPRRASRLLLEVTEIRAQRLQKISEADAAAEGIEFEYPDLDEPATAGGEWFRPGRHGFKNLWDSLNAKRGYGWELDPWVWAITFRPLPSGNKETL